MYVTMSFFLNQMCFKYIIICFNEIKKMINYSSFSKDAKLSLSFLERGLDPSTVPSSYFKEEFQRIEAVCMWFSALESHNKKAYHFLAVMSPWHALYDAVEIATYYRDVHGLVTVLAHLVNRQKEKPNRLMYLVNDHYKGPLSDLSSNDSQQHERHERISIDLFREQVRQQLNGLVGPYGSLQQDEG